MAQYYRGDQKEKEPQEAIIYRPTVAVRAPVQTTNLPSNLNSEKRNGNFIIIPMPRFAPKSGAVRGDASLRS